jgi:Na+/melibiose symporter-like transporter
MSERNPVVGRISDRAGSRRPFLLGGGLALAVLFAAIFAGPFRSGVPAALYVAFAFLATATAFAFFQVPYVRCRPNSTDSYTERTRLMTWRVAVPAVAILVSGAVAPVVVNAGGDGIAGHRLMGVFVAVIIVLGVLGVYFGTARVGTDIAGESEPSLQAQLRVASSNNAFRGLLACFVVQAAGIATMLAGVQYFATHVLGDEDTGATVLFACFVGPALLVMPLWRRVGQTARVPDRLVDVRGGRRRAPGRTFGAGRRRLFGDRGDRRRLRRPAGVRTRDAAGLHRL